MDIIKTVYYIHGAELMKFIFAVYMCHEWWALHVVKKRKFFYIYIYICWQYVSDASAYNNMENEMYIRELFVSK